MEKNLERNLKAIYNGELYNPNKKNYGDQSDFNSLKEMLKIIGEMMLKSLGTAVALGIDDIIKSVYGVGTIAGIAIGAIADAGIVFNYLNKAKKYFESKCQADDGTIFFTTRCMSMKSYSKHLKNLKILS